MSRLVLSGVGWLAFAVLSGFHVVSLWRIAGYYFPALAAAFAVLLALAWLSIQVLFFYAIKTNRLKACMLAVFVYVMGVLLIGTRVLEGVPAEVGEGQWRDPDQRLAPEDKYLLHNHSNVVRALSEAEYWLHLNYGTCYFTAGFMLFAAALCLNPLDRDGQLFRRRPVMGSILDRQRWGTTRCARCRGIVPGDASGRFPPWCPHCGVDLNSG